ncbi:MAG TPA: signal peptidase II [Polyangia bacterium]|nr:signal peptidase II [Polyangia bacterium]
MSEPASSPSARRKYLLFAIFTAISLVLDQWTKILARHHLRPRGPYNPKVIVDGWFDLRYAENPGVAFSMLQDIPGGRIWLTILAVGAFVLVLYYLRKTPIENTRLHVALGLVGGGAIGNLVDRVIYGRVTDFIVWKVVLKKPFAWLDPGLHEWPAFNIADAALCIGVGLMLLDMAISWWAARKAHAQTPPAKA